MSAGHRAARTGGVGRVGRGRPPRSAVRAEVRRCLADLEPGRRVIVALSGGADSLALLAAVQREAPTLGLLVEVVVVDHGLQPGSRRAAARAAEQAAILGCTEVSVVAVDVKRGPGAGGPEAAARVARYAALAEAAAIPPGGAASGADSSARRGPPAVVLLGHTRDDQAETVLLALARGSGTRSLSGMAPTSGIYRRPLLDLPRELVARAAAQAAQEDPRLGPWLDPHNEDRSFARVRVRSDLLASLEEALGPGVAAALARSADLARDDAEALDEWAQRVWAGLPDMSEGSGGARGGVWRLDPTAMAVGQPVGRARAEGGPEGGAGSCDRLPRAVVTRVVRRFLIGAGCPAGSLSADHVRAVWGLLERGGPEVALPGGRVARREGGAVVVRA